MQRASRIRTKTQNAHRDLEAVVQRYSLIEQKLRGACVVLRSCSAPALLVPALESGKKPP
jgi:hypothetical protein